MAANVDIVREQFEATNRRDFAAPMEVWAEDIEIVALPADLREGTFHGRETAGEWFGDWFRQFTDVHFDLLRLEGAGDSVAVAARHSARGKHSGAEVVNELFYEYRLDAGRIVRIKFHPSWEDALAAVRARA